MLEMDPSPYYNRLMKVCQKCRRNYEDVWQVCGDCKVALVKDMRPLYRSVLKITLSVVALIIAFIPTVSIVLRALKIDRMLPAFLRKIVLVVTSPWILAISFSITILALFYVVPIILSEEASPDALDREANRSLNNWY